MKKYFFYFALLLLVLMGCRNTHEPAKKIENQGVTENSRMSMTSPDMLSNCQGGNYGDVCYMVYQFGYAENITRGKNGSSSPTPSILSIGNIFQMPSTPQALFVESDSTDDALSGAGAQEITIMGLDKNWRQLAATVTLNGTSAVAVTPNFLRVNKAYVSKSGTYLSDTPLPSGIINGSNIGTVRIYSASQDWAYIIGPDSSSSHQSEISIGAGETQIGAFTVPKGYAAILVQANVTVPNNKSASLYLYSRNASDSISSPYDGSFHLLYKAEKITISGSIGLNGMFGWFEGPTDILTLGKLENNGRGEIGINFQLLLVKIGKLTD